MKKLVKKTFAVLVTVGLALSTWTPVVDATTTSGTEKIYYNYWVDGDTYGLARMNPDGKKNEVLPPVDPTLDVRSPKVSPQGDRLIYSIYGTMFLAKPDGTEATDIPIFGQYPSWFPSSDKIAYKGNDGDIWISQLDGNGQVNLTNTPDISEWLPDVSPDGSKIAFVRQVPSQLPEIVIMNIDGTVLNTMVMGTAPQSLEWSPDGSKLLFWDSSWDIFTINSDGTQLSNLTGDLAYNSFSPTWSPDGTKIAFTLRINTGSSIYDMLYIMNADGSAKTAICEIRGAPSDWAIVNK